MSENIMLGGVSNDDGSDVRIGGGDSDDGEDGGDGDDDDDGDDGVCVMTKCTEVVWCLAGCVVTPDSRQYLVSF